MGMSEEQIGVVTPQDVAEIQKGYAAGTVVSASTLYGVLSKMMGEQRRPLAHQTAFGHALRREGWVRHRVRRRFAGRPTEISAWIVPGPRALDDESAHVYDALTRMGGGIHPNLAIFEAYQELAREEGWAASLDFNGLQRWLTKKGFVRMTEKGKPSRFVDPTRVAARD